MSFEEDLKIAQSAVEKRPKEVRMMDGMIAKLDLDLGALIASGRRDTRAAAKARGILRRRHDLAVDIELAGFEAQALNVEGILRNE